MEKNMFQSTNQIIQSPLKPRSSHVGSPWGGAEPASRCRRARSSASCSCSFTSLQALSLKHGLKHAVWAMFWHWNRLTSKAKELGGDPLVIKTHRKWRNSPRFCLPLVQWLGGFSPSPKICKSHLEILNEMTKMQLVAGVFGLVDGYIHTCSDIETVPATRILFHRSHRLVWQTPGPTW